MPNVHHRPARPMWRARGLLAVLLSGGTAAVATDDIAAQARVEIAQEPVFTSYTMREGLSQGVVEALMQDSTGFLWVGTHDGLNRFDGVGFRSYRHRADDSTSLGDDFIQALAPGPRGKIWVGTYRGGLDLFDPRTGRAEHYELPELGPWLLDMSAPSTEDRSGRTVAGIVVLAETTLLLATDAGLARFDVAAGHAELVEAGSSGVPREAPTSLCTLPDRSALAAFRDGRSFRITSRTGITPAFVLSASIEALRCPEKEGHGLVATSTGVVYSFGPGDREPRRLFSLTTTDASRFEIPTLIEDARGSVWVGTIDGLYLREPGSPPRLVGTGDRGLPNAHATTFLSDQRDVLWLGTWNGLAKLHPSAMSMLRVPNASETGPGLAGDGVIAVEKERGGYWIGTMSGGLHLLRVPPGRGGMPTLERVVTGSPVDHARIFDLAGDGGDLWIAAMDEGVWRFDARSRVARRIPIAPRSPQEPVRPTRRSRSSSAAGSTVYSVFKDRSGVIWAGSRPGGLLRFDPDEGRFSPFHGPDGEWDYGSNWAWSVVEDRGGVLWVGAYTGGLVRISADRQEYRLYTVDSGVLLDDRILTLLADDERGVIWIGTEGAGLHRFDPTTAQVRAFTSADGLPHDHVEGILADRDGRLWITTNDGVARFDPASGLFRTYRDESGLVGNRFFANAAFRDDSGLLILGGEDGLTVLDPRQLEDSPPLPRVALTSFFVHGRERPLADALAPGGLRLGPNENFFAFNFAALDFRDGGQSQYRYRLMGLDEDWVDAGPGRTANYTSVPHGRYVFRVGVRTAGGIWTDEGLDIPVRVNPHYYETWWFQSLVALGVLAMISGLYAYRLTQIQQRQRLRLEIAGRLHDDIGADLSTIALKADMLRASSRDERGQSQLSDVGRLAREAAHRVRETVWVVNTKYDTLAGLLSKLRDTADVMLGGQVPFRFASPESPPHRAVRMELRQDIYLVFKEALNNVLKHADASNVRIDVEYSAGRLSLCVCDDGGGFDPDGLSDEDEGSGQASMRMRVAKYGGTIEIESAPGSGTTVRSHVPLR